MFKFYTLDIHLYGSDLYTCHCVRKKIILVFGHEYDNIFIFYSMNLGDTLCIDNYQQWFETLLWLERLQAELDIQIYNKDNAPVFYTEENNEVTCVELEV